MAVGPAARHHLEQLLDGLARVELRDNSTLDRLLPELGAVRGKAYPALGFALIELDRATHPVDAVDRLSVDPRVIEATLQLEQSERDPMPAPTHGSNPATSRTAPSVGATDKNALDPRLTFRLRAGYGESGRDPLMIAATIFNLGIVQSSPNYLQIYVDGSGQESEWLHETRFFPGIDGKSSYRMEIPLALAHLGPGQTYYVSAKVYEDGEYRTRARTGFSLDSLQRVQHTCIEPGRGSVSGMADPLESHQWYLENTGQPAFAKGGGAVDEDLQMDDILDDGPTGNGIRVAIVDSGLEICHPDLRDNIETGASYNFNANLFESASPWWYTAEVTDPFNSNSTGDHGTRLAGVIAAAANNGIGGRGVAPDALIRGYNYLRAQSSIAFLDSLGASSVAPNSTDVDIFNMSFGGIQSLPTNVSADRESLFAHGAGSTAASNRPW